MRSYTKIKRIKSATVFFFLLLIFLFAVNPVQADTEIPVSYVKRISNVTSAFTTWNVSYIAYTENATGEFTETESYFFFYTPGQPSESTAKMLLAQLLYAKANGTSVDVFYKLGTGPAGFLTQYRIITALNTNL